MEVSVADLQNPFQILRDGRNQMGRRCNQVAAIKLCRKKKVLLCQNRSGSGSQIPAKMASRLIFASLFRFYLGTLFAIRHLSRVCLFVCLLSQWTIQNRGLSFSECKLVNYNYVCSFRVVTLIIETCSSHGGAEGHLLLFN